jgi:hypothetical protein
LARQLSVGNTFPATGRSDAGAELEQAKTEARRAWAAAERARVALVKTKQDAKFRLRVTAVLMMTVALAKMAWVAANSEPEATAPTVVQPMAKSAGGTPANSATDGTGSTIALDRLRDAFHSFPDEDQPDVVREVNRRYAGSEFACPLSWTDGFPALWLKNSGKVEPMMATALNQCAAGVEKLRQERDAANEKLAK